ATSTLIKLMGGINAIQGIEGFKPLTAEAVAAAKPDIILMTKSGAESLGGTDAIFNLPGMKITPAAAKKNILLDDDLRLLTIGPRTAEVIEAMHARLEANKG
ncbi:MAG: hemin ABC transporter substrate-binding protein, partial [Proteobacteria bacterium]